MTPKATPLRSACLLFAGTAGLLLAAALPAGAQATSSRMEGMQLSNDKPIQIESDQLEIREQDNVAVFTGNVNVVQGTTTLKSGHMVVHYQAKGKGTGESTGAPSISSGNTNIERIELEDGVLLTSGAQKATGDSGTFEMATQTFVLKGKRVVLSEGQNVFVGCMLTVLAQTGEAKLDACGGRVKIQLDPQSQKKQ